MPFFSIVIPTYNSSKYIKETIESLRMQSCQDYEVIIVDDCSDDLEQLNDVIRKFIVQGLNIRVLSQIVKQNAAVNRNIGINASKGRYICFLDSDDKFHSDKLSEIKIFISSNKVENSVIYHKVDLLDANNLTKMTMPKNAINIGESVIEYLFVNQGFMQTSSLVLSKELATKILFNESFNRHQDYDFCIRAQYLGVNFLMIDKVLSSYKISDESSIKRKGESIQYSRWWLSQMKIFLIKRDRCIFELFFIGRKYFIERMYFNFFVNIVFTAPFVGFDNIFKKIFFSIKKRM